MSQMISPATTQTEPAAPPVALAAAGPLDRPPAPARPRLDSIDLLRGLVMVLMLLDHTRDFFHAGALRFDPTDLTQTTAPIFLTRWITHFCAPIFVFLAGTGAYLQRARGKSRGELSKFLLTRGLWLVLLEFTLVRLGFTFNFDYRFLGAAQVIWVIGVSMIVLAALVYLPVRVIAALGLAMIALHNLFDGIQVPPWQGPGSADPGVTGRLWMILHQPGAFPVVPNGPVVFALYPLVPWVGVMAAGYAFGAVYGWEAVRRRRFLIRVGLGLVALFLVLRAVNFYGDPRPWSGQPGAVMTVLSFLNLSKYPPSLLYLLMTLGPALLLLAWFEARRHGLFGQVMITYGRVPLFYYLLQWPTAKGLALLLNLLLGKDVGYLFTSLPLPSADLPPDAGFGLPVVYLFWFVGLLLLYPLCRWFGRLKQRRREWWLSYL